MQPQKPAEGFEQSAPANASRRRSASGPPPLRDGRLSIKTDEKARRHQPAGLCQICGKSLKKTQKQGQSLLILFLPCTIIPANEGIANNRLRQLEPFGEERGDILAFLVCSRFGRGDKKKNSGLRDSAVCAPLRPGHPGHIPDYCFPAPPCPGTPGGR